MLTPSETLTSFYAAETAFVAAGGADENFDAVAVCLDTEAVVFQSPGLPFTCRGTWNGHAGVKEWMRLFAATWQEISIADYTVIESSERAVVSLDVTFTSRATGRQVSTSILQDNRFRAGRLLSIRPFYWDVAAVADACRP